MYEAVLGTYHQGLDQLFIRLLKEVDIEAEGKQMGDIKAELDSNNLFLSGHDQVVREGKEIMKGIYYIADTKGEIHTMGEVNVLMKDLQTLETEVEIYHEQKLELMKKEMEGFDK